MNMTTAEKLLLEMKQKLDGTKPNIARMKGRRDQLYKTLKDDCNCRTLKEAEKQLTMIGKRLNEKEAILIEGVAKLEKKHDWS
jgi:hypothetical protein